MRRGAAPSSLFAQTPLPIPPVPPLLPVLPVQDHVYQGFETVIPYEKFAIRVGVKDVPQLLQILRSFTTQDLAGRRLEMAK